MPIPSDRILELERFLNVDVKASLDGAIGWLFESKVDSRLQRNFCVMRGFLNPQITVNLMPGKLWFGRLLLCYHKEMRRARSI
jgi:hypothetical protein